MKNKVLFGLVVACCWCFNHSPLHAQGDTQIDVTDGSDPATMKSRVTLDFESDLFYNESKFYTVRPGYYFGLGNGRHLFGLAVPFLHNVFNGNYGGFENTTGIGDIRMLYMGIPYINKGAIGLERVSGYMEVTAPTGQSRLGRGAGAWLYKPGLILTYRLTPDVALYPEVRFQFSGGKANSLGGTDGLPDAEDPEKDNKLQNFSVQMPLIIQLQSLEAWIGLNPQYMRSFSEDNYFLFLRTDFGKMVGDKTSLSVTISKFIAGQPRLNVIVQGRFQFFLGR